MCVCVCVCVCIYIYICICVCIKNIYICVCVCVFIQCLMFVQLSFQENLHQMITLGSVILAGPMHHYYKLRVS